MIPDLCTAAGDAHATAACVAMCAAKIALAVALGLAAARLRRARIASGSGLRASPG